MQRSDTTNTSVVEQIKCLGEDQRGKYESRWQKAFIQDNTLHLETKMQVSFGRNDHIIVTDSVKSITYFGVWCIIRL